MSAFRVVGRLVVCQLSVVAFSQQNAGCNPCGESEMDSGFYCKDGEIAVG